MTRRESPKPASRRRFLVLGATGTIIGLGGCTLPQGGSDGADRNETNASTNGDDTGDERGECEGSRSGADGTVDPANQWLQPRADAQNSGANLAASGPSLESESGWVYPDQLFGLAGSIYDPCLRRDTVFFSTEEATHALDVADGDSKWSVPTTDVTRPSQILAGGMLVRKMSGVVEALDPATGCSNWRVDVENDVREMTAAESFVLARSPEAGVIALSARDGVEQWRFERQEKHCTQIAADRERAYIGFEEDLYAVDLESGAEAWRAELDLEHGLGRFLVVDGDHVYIHHDQEIVAVGVSEGNVSWRSPARLDVTTQPTIAGDKLIVGIENTTPEQPPTIDGLAALSAADGSERWRQEELRDEPSGLPVLARNGLYVPEEAFMERLDPETGTIESSAIDDGTLYWNLAVTEGALVGTQLYGHEQTRLHSLREGD